MEWGSLKSYTFCPLSTHRIAMTHFLSNSPVATESAGGSRAWGYVHADDQAYMGLSLHFTLLNCQSSTTKQGN